MKKILIALLTLILVGALAGGTWYYITTNSGEYKLMHPDDWEIKSEASYSIRLPAGMEPVNVVNLDNTYRELGNFGNSAVVVGIYYADMNAQQAKVIKEKGLKDLFDMVKQTINGKELIPVERGDYVYWEYARNAAGFFSGTNDIWVYEGIYVGTDKLYEVSVACPHDKNSDYREYILKILDSFRIH